MCRSRETIVIQRSGTATSRRARLSSARLQPTPPALIQKRRHPLRAGTLLLIERGTKHEIRNTGQSPLRTLNLYVPPAYRKDGEPLARGKP
jgi:hypothetical protein